MRQLCQIIGHRRSARHVRFDYAVQRWRTSCSCCGAPMLKVHGEWRILERTYELSTSEMCST